MSVTFETIAVDAMGGDFGPSVTVPAAVAALQANTEVKIILVGLEEKIQAQLAACDYSTVKQRIEVVHAPEVVEMTDSVSVALRTKKQSSMRIALNLVKERRAGAAVSAGNTGALMAVSRFVLKTHPLIDRPAICTALPTQKGHCLVLDLGANVDSNAEHLYQFALMGNILATAVEGIENPRIGVLNIGEEEIKGNDVVKGALQLIANDSRLNSVGYIEGDGIFGGEADVVVCDGFVGNIALKTSEGVARMITNKIKEKINKNIFTKISGALAFPIWRALAKELNPSQYNGASLVGLRGLAIKSHGGTDILGFKRAIDIAVLETRKGVPDLIDEYMQATPVVDNNI